MACFNLHKAPNFVLERLPNLLVVDVLENTPTHSLERKCHSSLLVQEEQHSLATRRS